MLLLKCKENANENSCSELRTQSDTNVCVKRLIFWEGILTGSAPDPG